MANRIKLAGTTANSFTIGLNGVTLNTANIGPYQLNLPANVGANAQVLTTDGTGNLSWTTPTGGGGNGTPGGTNTQVQFNDNGSFGGNANLTFNKITSLLSVVGNISAGNVILASNAGVVYVNNITGLAGQPVVIQSDGTEDISLNADTIRIGDNNTDATIATHGAGDLILRTHLGDANQGNIIISDGANGNISLQPNGTGIVIANSALSATGNVSANFFIGNGSQLTGLPTANGIANGTSNVRIPTANGNILFSSNAANSMNITSSNVIIGNGTGGVISGVGTLTANTINTTDSNIGTLRVTTLLSAIGNTVLGNTTAGNLTASNANITVALTTPTLSATSHANVGNLSVSAVANLGNIANVRILGGSNGQIMTTFGNGTVTWASPGVATALVNGNSNVVVAANSNVTLAVAGIANLTTFTNANIIFGTVGSGANITGANVITANTANIGNINLTGNIIDTGPITILTSANGNVNLSPNGTGITQVNSTLSVTGNTNLSALLKVGVYTIAALTAITGSVGQVAAVSNSTPGGMLAYWDTTNSRWSYIHDNSAV